MVKKLGAAGSFIKKKKTHTHIFTYNICVGINVPSTQAPGHPLLLYMHITRWETSPTYRDLKWYLRPIIIRLFSLHVLKKRYRPVSTADTISFIQIVLWYIVCIWYPRGFVARSRFNYFSLYTYSYQIMFYETTRFILYYIENMYLYNV